MEYVNTDKRLGYSIILALGAVVGGLAMLLKPGELLGAGGFGLALIAGLVLIMVLHAPGS